MHLPVGDKKESHVRFPDEIQSAVVATTDPTEAIEEIRSAVATLPQEDQVQIADEIQSVATTLARDIRNAVPPAATGSRVPADYHEAMKVADEVSKAPVCVHRVAVADIKVSSCKPA